METNIMRTNMTIFLLFFGVAVLDALRAASWWRVAAWLVVALLFLFADYRHEFAQRKDRETAGSPRA